MDVEAASASLARMAAKLKEKEREEIEKEEREKAELGRSQELASRPVEEEGNGAAVGANGKDDHSDYLVEDGTRGDESSPTGVDAAPHNVEPPLEESTILSKSWAEDLKTGNGDISEKYVYCSVLSWTLPDCGV